ncbi:hypothetical protein TCAL_09579 [Tigriopus californicus]|uniref:beta-N-acetylhexosaminidase n=1 Tax=Tigriopus californicus TaxID=6832 RepID=A0A553PFK9_TIGCA|nr:hexosaminidase D-like [Tigriopus californicus]XP_059082445.1 hexosaminidase D-like [Tigriopus californicus]TRY76461.1 hypothetical protein TCAL_09579 [Tigriopus californicus]|eukprot:TCALIF_09579-PA protein Name:"Similar to Hexdc Hexosaminidase D (Mus musculus)" AED:0.03 eAED:0.03 QI:168/1/1/1/0.5/0.66/3/320/728
MVLVSSYLSRLWRRKTAILGALAGATILIICLQVRGQKKTENLDHRDVHYNNKILLAARKNEPDLSSPESKRGVRFIPGVPGHDQPQIKIPVEHRSIQDDELAYLQKRNKQLFESEAKAAKAKMNQVRVKTKLDPKMQGLQPFQEDNVEYGQSVGQVPIYREQFERGGHGQMISKEEIKLKEAYIPRQRLIHFDLKGAPPKMDYLIKVLELARKLGATGVLIEYEDMFPFEGRLEAVRAKNHYTRGQIQDLVDACERLGLELIPLIQTFGHLEFILKLEQFAHLRDSAEMPESICPCHHETMFLIKESIDQVMNLHKKHINYVHIGCDEVYHLGECEPCQSGSRNSIFVNHVSAVAKYVRDIHHKRVIIWDDMLRNFMPIEMEPLGGLVEPMVWVYAEDVYRFMPTYNWDRFAEIFPTAWTASAFKGAHGPTLMMPPIQKHLENTLNWLDVMQSEESKFKGGFQGIVLTGWQRYDHFAILAELLPVGLPSLAVDLLTVKNGFFNATVQSQLTKSMECVGTPRDLDEPLDLTSDPYLSDKMSWCYFPGASVFKLAYTVENTRKEVEEFLKKVREDQGWMRAYSIRRNYTSPFRVNEVMQEWSMNYDSVVSLMRSAKQTLSELFDIYTVAEWVEQRIYPMYQELKLVKDQAESLKFRRVWQPRPLEPLKELEEFGIGLEVSNKARDATNSLHNVDDTIPNDNSDKLEAPQGNAIKKRLVQAPDYYRRPRR